MSQMTWKKSIQIICTILGAYLSIRYADIAIGIISVVIASSLPLFIGGAIAFIVNIVMSFYEKHYFSKSSKSIVKKTRRPACMLGAIVTIVLRLFLL